MKNSCPQILKMLDKVYALHFRNYFTNHIFYATVNSTVPGQ